MRDSQMRILFIENNPADAQIIGGMLSDNDGRLDLVFAGSLDAGLKHLSSTKFDAILLDLGLLDSRDFETSVRVPLSECRASDLPIVVLTGSADDELAARIVREGAHDYLEKGHLTRGLLLRAIRYAIERQRAEAQLREAEIKYRMLVEQIPAITYIKPMDEAKSTSYVSPQIERLLGFLPEEWIADPGLWSRQLHPEDRERVLSEQGLSPSRGLQSEYRLLTRGGQVLWVHDRAAVVMDELGEPLFMQGVMLDVTERKHAEAALKEALTSLERWAKELEERNLEMSLLSQMAELLQTCHGAEEAHNVIAQFARQLFPSSFGALFTFQAPRNLMEIVATWGGYEPSERIFASTDCWAMRRGQVHCVVPADMQPRCRHVGDEAGASFCMPMISQGETLGLLNILMGHEEAEKYREGQFEAKQRLARSLAEHIGLALGNIRLRQTLRTLSIRDSVTDLFNRHHAEESLKRELNRADRKGLSLGIILIHLGQFEHLTAKLGRHAGDSFLKDFSKLLCKYLRQSDIACRYDNVEFLLILPEASLEVTTRRAGQIVEEHRLEQIMHDPRSEGTLTVSMGIAVFPDHGRTAKAILQSADFALSLARQSSDDRVVVAP